MQHPGQRSQREVATHEVAATRRSDEHWSERRRGAGECESHGVGGKSEMGKEARLVRRARGRTLGWIGVVMMLAGIAPWVVLWADVPVEGTTVEVLHSWELLGGDLLGGAAVPLLWTTSGIAVLVACCWLLSPTAPRGLRVTSLVLTWIALAASVASLAAVVSKVVEVRDLGAVGFGASLGSLPGPGVVLPVIGSVVLAIAGFRGLNGGSAHAPTFAPGATFASAEAGTGHADGTSWTAEPASTVLRGSVEALTPSPAPDPSPGQSTWPPGTSAAWTLPSSYPPGHLVPTEFSPSRTSLNPWVPVAVLVAALVIGGGVLGVVTSASSTTVADTTPNTTTTPSPTTTTASPSTSSPPSMSAPTTLPPATVPSTGGRDAGIEERNQQLAIEELGRYADGDRSSAELLVDRWVPQVSSKKPGLDVAGDDLPEYTAAAVLSDHVAYRARYVGHGGGALLVRSGDFSSFKNGDFWVTVIALPFDTPEAANAWCDEQNIRPDDCFAKRLSHTAPWRGSSEARK